MFLLMARVLVLTRRIYGGLHHDLIPQEYLSVELCSYEYSYRLAYIQISEVKDTNYCQYCFIGNWVRLSSHDMKHHDFARSRYQGSSSR